jgi:hypothetical protein
MRDLQDRLMDGLSRSATVVLSNQINLSLRRYFDTSELLLVVLSGHVLLCMMLPGGMPGFNASWRALKGLVQSLAIQLVVGYVTEGQTDEAALFNLVAVLLGGECVQRTDWWAHEDVQGLATSVSYIVSDRVSGILRGLGVPTVGAALGIFFGGYGLLGSTLALTGVNALSAAAFEAVKATSSLALAWPVVLLYFVHEAARRFEKAEDFLNFGMYKASDAVYAGLERHLRPGVLSLLFFLLVVASPEGDEVWTGVCALALVRAASEWFLTGVVQAAQSDAFLGGLCVVTVVHFATVALERLKNKP